MVPALQCDALVRVDPLAAVSRAVGAAKIDQPVAAVPRFDEGVLARDRVVLQHDVVLRVASDGGAPGRQGQRATRFTEHAAHVEQLGRGRARASVRDRGAAPRQQVAASDQQQRDGQPAEQARPPNGFARLPRRGGWRGGRVEGCRQLGRGELIDRRLIDRREHVVHHRLEVFRCEGAVVARAGAPGEGLHELVVGAVGEGDAEDANTILVTLAREILAQPAGELEIVPCIAGVDAAVREEDDGSMSAFASALPQLVEGALDSGWAVGSLAREVEGGERLRESIPADELVRGGQRLHERRLIVEEDEGDASVDHRIPGERRGEFLDGAAREEIGIVRPHAAGIVQHEHDVDGLCGGGAGGVGRRGVGRLGAWNGETEEEAEQERSDATATGGRGTDPPAHEPTCRGLRANRMGSSCHVAPRLRALCRSTQIVIICVESGACPECSARMEGRVRCACP